MGFIKTQNFDRPTHAKHGCPEKLQMRGGEVVAAGFSLRRNDERL